MKNSNFCFNEADSDSYTFHHNCHWNPNDVIAMETSALMSFMHNIRTNFQAAKHLVGQSSVSQMTTQECSRFCPKSLSLCHLLQCVLHPYGLCKVHSMRVCSQALWLLQSGSGLFPDYADCNHSSDWVCLLVYIKLVVSAVWDWSRLTKTSLIWTNRFIDDKL